MSAVLRALNQLCYFVCFLPLFGTYFVHNVDATISYDRKELPDIRTAITHLELDEDIFFNESEAKDISNVAPRQGPNHCHSREENK